MNCLGLEIESDIPELGLNVHMPVDFSLRFNEVRPERREILTQNVSGWGVCCFYDHKQVGYAKFELQRSPRLMRIGLNTISGWVAAMRGELVLNGSRLALGNCGTLVLSPDHAGASSLAAACIKLGMQAGGEGAARLVPEDHRFILPLDHGVTLVPRPVCTTLTLHSDFTIDGKLVLSMSAPSSECRAPELTALVFVKRAAAAKIERITASQTKILLLRSLWNARYFFEREMAPTLERIDAIARAVPSLEVSLPPDLAQLERCASKVVHLLQAQLTSHAEPSVEIRV